MIVASITGTTTRGIQMADNTVRGRFVWHELVTPNGEGAHEFYSKAVGWKTQAWEQDSSYQMFVASTGPLGATVESRDGVPHWVPYVGVTDVDATVAKATALGAKVAMEPASLPNAGRYAVLTDPHGATFGVHASGAEPSPEKDPALGEFSWHELATTAGPVEAFGFYKELVGWDELDQYDMGPAGIYLLFGRNGRQLGGMFNKGSVGKPGPAYWLCYVRSANVDKMAADVKAARGMVLMEPDAVPGGHRIAQFEDPHGAFFAGHTLAEDVKAAPAKKPAAAKAAAKPAATPAAKPAAKPAGKAPAKSAAKPKAMAKKPVKKKAAKKAAQKRGAKVVKKKTKKAAKKAAQKTAQKTARKAGKKTKKVAARKKAPTAGKKKGKRR
jgi:predicted enzyme related to lactoylglutathione lyase